jgi:hypothetical protein
VEHPCIHKICDEIAKLLSPYKIILFSVKDGTLGKPSSFKLCVIADVANTREAESLVYLNIDSEISFDILVYKIEEWNTLLEDPHSFASRIAEKGIAIYE